MELGILLFAATFLPSMITGSVRRVCYFSNWAQYREASAKFLPENIDPNLCTHIIYAFATMEGNRLKPFEVNDLELYARINALKKSTRSLKTLLGVGGWNFGTAKMTAMLATERSRREFTKTTAEYLRRNGFDGIDLDFEYPGSRGSPAQDKDNFAQLCEEMRQAFEAEGRESHRPRLLLTAAVAAGKDNIDRGYDVPRISRSLDFINVMTYDLHGPWDKAIGHNAPMKSRPGDSDDQKHLCVEWAAEYWHSLGVPRSQLVLGMPTYGRCFTLRSPSQHDFGNPIAGPGRPGRYTRQKGFLAYYEICEMARQSTTARKVWDDNQQVPYMFDGDQWVGYDDAKSLTHKVKWLKSKGYGGWMVWNLDLDDFNGTFCGQGKYPLINAMKSALSGHHGPYEPITKEGDQWKQPVGQAREEHPTADRYPTEEIPVRYYPTYGNNPWNRLDTSYRQQTRHRYIYLPPWQRWRYYGDTYQRPASRRPPHTIGQNTTQYHHLHSQTYTPLRPQTGYSSPQYRPTQRTVMYRGHSGVKTKLDVSKETKAKRKWYLESIAKAEAGRKLQNEERRHVGARSKSLVPGNKQPIHPHPRKHEFCETHKTGIHPHPNEHCFMYLWCSNGYLYEYSCGKDTVFDPVLLVCHWPNAVPSRRHCAGRKSTGNHFG